MRIGIDARMYSSKFTGIGRYTYELIRNIIDMDKINEYYIFLKKDEYINFDDTEPNIHKVLADISHYTFAEQFKLPFIYNKYNLDVLHFTHFNAPIFFSAKKILVTIHDLTLSFFPGRKLKSSFHRLAYNITINNIVKKSDIIIAVSNNTKKDICSHMNVNKGKIHVIYEGVDSKFSVPNSNKDIFGKYDLDYDYILYTGVWRKHKNVIGLLKALRKILDRYDKTIKLVMTGKDDQYYNDVRATIKQLDLNKHIKLLGLIPEEDLPALYRNAKLYVFPSFYEGFGLPPLEAMASGTPVVASFASAIPEICGEGNAVFFDPYDIDDMANKIYSVYSDTVLRDRLISNGKSRIKDFSWGKMTKQIIKLYES